MRACHGARHHRKQGYPAGRSRCALKRRDAILQAANAPFWIPASPPRGASLHLPFPWGLLFSCNFLMRNKRTTVFEHMQNDQISSVPKELQPLFWSYSKAVEIAHKTAEFVAWIAINAKELGRHRQKVIYQSHIFETKILEIGNQIQY